MRTRAFDVSVSIYLRVDIHKDAGRLRDGVDFARNYDSAGARDPRIVVRVGEAHRTAARTGVVALFDRNPRLGADRMPDIVYSSGDADLSRTGVARNFRRPRADAEIVRTLAHKDFLVADRDGARADRSVADVRRNNIDHLACARSGIAAVHELDPRIGRIRLPLHVAVRIDGEGIHVAVRAEYDSVIVIDGEAASLLRDGEEAFGDLHRAAARVDGSVGRGLQRHRSGSDAGRSVLNCDPCWRLDG